MPANRGQVIRDDLGIETGVITAEEMTEAVKNAKNNKAPGTNKIVNESIKLLDEEKREEI